MLFDVDAIVEKVRFLTAKNAKVVLMKYQDTLKAVVLDEITMKLLDKNKNILGVYNSEISDKDLIDDLKYLKEFG
jgi:hypothetical protein